MCRNDAVLICFGLMALAGGRLSADPIFSASAAPFSSFGSPCLITFAGGTSSVPIAADISCSDSGSTASGQAHANPGSIGAEAASSNFSNTSLPARGTSDASYADNVIFTSSDPTKTSTVVSMNFVASGKLAEKNDDASVTFTANLNGNTEIAFTVDEGLGVVTCHGIIGNAPACGSVYNLASLTGVNVIVPLDTPVSFSMEISAFALSSDGFVPFDTSASAKFGDTFEFPLSGPVFNLEDGVTANSADSFIVDNRFLPPTAGTPEPGAWPLALAPIVALLWRRRRAAPRS